MANNGVTRSQALMSLSMLNPALRRMSKLGPPIGEAPNQLEVFSVVAKHLSALVDAFTSLEDHLESIAEEADEISDTYAVIHEAAEACCTKVRYLQQLFEAVKKSQNKIGDYRTAVACCDGKPLETLMLEMLQEATTAATPPMVPEEHITALHDALEQIKKLPASLDDEPPRAYITLHNHGAGNQFYHGGKGNMNHCSGGFQVTGDNQGATYNHGPMGSRQN